MSSGALFCIFIKESVKRALHLKLGVGFIQAGGGGGVRVSPFIYVLIDSKGRWGEGYRCGLIMARERGAIVRDQGEHIVNRNNVKNSI